MFFDFSSAFNTIQPSLLRGKMEGAGIDCHLAAWTTDYLTNRLQYVRLRDCESDVVVCSTGAPQGTVLSPFLFTLYTSDFSHNSDSCHLQKFSDDTAIVGRVSEGNELEYREVITNFVAWCELNHLRINASKTKEVVIDFSRKASHTAPVNIQGLDIEIVEEYKYLGVHLNNKLDWTHNTDALYKKGQSRLHLLRRLRSFGVCRTLLRTFYDSVVALVIFYAVVCWSVKAQRGTGRYLTNSSEGLAHSWTVLWTPLRRWVRGGC
ncbi:putative RNA-directed DNA polymerase from transposon BS [Takifugu flavidus]|uniref:Putative RNA-directed DNA polymerase from transposon BS n=1 Tax=Takifugu flavidus TaxID=433684 RepID=A0A5C6MS12_9TELE|nr:putative RNA-directed DNA polymerase from transposon BS [Takifugu flavidus]